MKKAKVGSGELEPFKKGSTHSESIAGSTNKEHVREGFTENVHITRASREEDKLTPFKTGPEAPGRIQNQESVPKFREKKDCGIDMMGYKPFKE